MDPEKNEKSASELSNIPGNNSYEPSSEEVQAIRQSRLQYLKWYFTSKEGWMGDYVSPFLIMAGQQWDSLFHLLFDSVNWFKD
jgi:hypothetical protein